MTVKIKAGKASGRVEAPPSKSMAHRYLICAALSGGSKISNLDFSKDISATIGCLKSLGAKTEVLDNTVFMGGIDFSADVSGKTLFCNESGSTLRFMIPICLLFNREITLTGSERLFKRSLEVYEQMCAAQGLYFKQTENSVTVKGRLSSGKYSVRGDISSQFISGLMFALSLIQGDSEINIEGKLESASYLGLTIKALADFGVRVSRIDEHTIFVKGSQTYKKRELSVEGDYSNAAFFEALNILGGNVVIKGLNPQSAQGDRVYGELFEQLTKGTPTIDISDCPDLGPVLMAVAAAKNGAVFTGTKRLKIKESDRGEAMKFELSKLGITVLTEENKITVLKGEFKKPDDIIFSHNDHRIVMAMAVLLTVTGGEIMNYKTVSKSFPDFFEKLSSLGIEVEYKDEID